MTIIKYIFWHNIKHTCFVDVVFDVQHFLVLLIEFVPPPQYQKLFKNIYYYESKLTAWVPIIQKIYPLNIETIFEFRGMKDFSGVLFKQFLELTAFTKAPPQNCEPIR